MVLFPLRPFNTSRGVNCRTEDTLSHLRQFQRNASFLFYHSCKCEHELRQPNTSAVTSRMLYFLYGDIIYRVQLAVPEYYSAGFAFVRQTRCRKSIHSFCLHSVIKEHKYKYITEYNKSQASNSVAIN